MKTRITMGALGSMMALAWVVGAGSVYADTLDCQRAIGSETQKFLASKSKTLAGCEQDIVKAKRPFGTDCAVEADVVDKITDAAAKMSAKIQDKCGEPGVDLGFLGGQCPDLEGLGCNNPITNAADVATCMECLAEQAVDQLIGLAHGAFTDPSGGGVCEGDGITECKDGDDCNGFEGAPGGRCDPTAKAIEGCQAAISKETQKFLAAKSKELSKCWDAALKGLHGDVCPDPNADPKSTAGKAAAKIQKAQEGMIEKICKACGGTDKVCGGTDGHGHSNDILPADIGIAASCASVTIPGGQECNAALGSVQTIADCLYCVSEFKADCLAAATYPSEFGPYPGTCNQAPQPPCTTADIVVQVDYVPPDPPNGDPVQGVDVVVEYPGSKLELIPPPVNETGATGTFIFGDNDTPPGDGFNDQLTAGLLVDLFDVPAGIPEGDFISADFNCREGAEGPDPAELSCTATATTDGFTQFNPGCSVILNVVP